MTVDYSIHQHGLGYVNWRKSGGREGNVLKPSARLFTQDTIRCGSLGCMVLTHNRAPCGDAIQPLSEAPAGKSTTTLWSHCKALRTDSSRMAAEERTGAYIIPVLCNSGAVRITGKPPDGANVILRRTTRTV